MAGSHVARRVGWIFVLVVGALLFEIERRTLIDTRNPNYVAVLALRRYRTVADGLLIGVASGAGFAALETMGYAFVALIVSRGDIQTVDGLLLLRGVLSPAGHMAWTGLTCAGLWGAANEGWSARSIIGFLLIFAMAVALHTAWDTVGTRTGYAMVGIVSIAALGFITHRISVKSRLFAGAVR
jgi:RsiW-degrading membrane proteinase PrsW (M82 family)